MRSAPYPRYLPTARIVFSGSGVGSGRAGCNAVFQLAALTVGAHLSVADA
ncbi:MAG: hypothetical protein WCB44_21365 [Stellaceae bacterium]